MTCSDMGGPATCTTVITGNSAEEMVANGMDHINEAHPDMASDIGKMTPEETSNWMTEFQKKFDAAPEM